VGAAIASYGIGYIHQITGNYTLAFMASGLFAFVANWLVVLINE
jgi:hypothetical protein